jgi:hypothetical protein
LTSTITQLHLIDIYKTKSNNSRLCILSSGCGTLKTGCTLGLKQNLIKYKSTELIIHRTFFDYNGIKLKVINKKWDSNQLFKNKPCVTKSMDESMIKKKK